MGSLRNDGGAGDKAAASNAVMQADAKRLKEMGYTQALTRTWGTLPILAMAISSTSVLTSIPASFSTGLTYGGPVVCIFGWIIISLLILCEGLGMAELTSAYPTSGGMYYWMYALTGEKWGPFFCWVTGWLNLLGQISSQASVQFLFANLISVMVSMITHDTDPSTAGTDSVIRLDVGNILAIYAGCLILAGIVNSAGHKFMTAVTNIGAVLHVVGTLVLIIAIPAVAPTHQTAKFVFTYFESQQAASEGIYNSFYIICLGLLLPAYSYTGIDGPAHMSEETRGAGTAPSKAIVRGIGFMFVLGLSWIISLLFSLTSIPSVLDGNNVTGGDAVIQIIWDAFINRYGTGTWAIVLTFIPLVGIWFCATAGVTYVSRIMYCYSRDKAVPVSWLWNIVEPKTQTPIYAVWAVVVAAFLLGLPMLGDVRAFNAIVSLSTISLHVAYVAPTLARITWGRHRFRPGPWHLGKWAYPIGVIAVLWVAFAAVIFCLPTQLPVNAGNLNYAAVVFVGTLLISIFWFVCPGIGAYRWFQGPECLVDELSFQQMLQPKPQPEVIREGSVGGGFSIHSGEHPDSLKERSRSHAGDPGTLLTHASLASLKPGRSATSAAVLEVLGRHSHDGSSTPSSGTGTADSRKNRHL